MKMRSIFDVVTDSSDVVDFFQDVSTPEQMISRLERIKRAPGQAQDLLTCLHALRMSMESFFEDTMELGGGGFDGDDLETGDQELEDLEETEETSPQGTPRPTSGSPLQAVPAASTETKTG
jgi:hypothetical protein